MTRLEPAAVDVEHLAEVRSSVWEFTQRVADNFIRQGDRVLDIAPQDHHGIAPFVSGAIVHTFDIDPSAHATYTGDICTTNHSIPAASYDHIVCTEVLEHTLRPFEAVAEMRRILRPGGRLYLSTPFDLRIHGPLPDCWRFTEHGLRELLSEFDILELNARANPHRPLMPIHYTVIAQRPTE